jgi:hypothetical protein
MERGEAHASRPEWIDVARLVAKAVIGIAACGIVYIGLAIAIYVPVYSIPPLPVDRDSWTIDFYARIAAGVAFHQVLAAVIWFAIARWVGLSRLLAATIVLPIILFLTLPTIGILTMNPG